MRRFFKLSLVCVAAGASACSTPDLVVPTEVLPYAGVRFINAVPDSAGAFGMDFRFIDIVESNAHFRIAFRNNPTGVVSTQIQYKGAREGAARRFRIFLDDTLQSIASTVVKDTTVSLVSGHNYTAMMWGNGRSAPTAADAMRLSFWEEDVAAPPPGQIALRVINTTSNAIDVWAFRSGTTPPATATWAAVPAYSRSAYAQVDSGTYQYQVRNAGVATNLFNNTTVPIGVVATCSGQPTSAYTATNPSGCPPDQPTDIEPIPGTKVAGTALTGVVFPRSVAGSRAPNFTTPAITYMWDRRPPRLCEPYC
jgi:hypothetical protein